MGMLTCGDDRDEKNIQPSAITLPCPSGHNSSPSPPHFCLFSFAGAFVKQSQVSFCFILVFSKTKLNVNRH